MSSGESDRKREGERGHVRERLNSDGSSVHSLTLSEIELVNNRRVLHKRAGSATVIASAGSVMKLSTPFSASQGKLPVELARRGSAESFKSIAEEKEGGREQEPVFRQTTEPKKRSNSLLQNQLLQQQQYRREGGSVQVSQQRVSAQGSSPWLTESRKLSIVRTETDDEGLGRKSSRKKAGSLRPGSLRVSVGKSKLFDYLNTRTKRNKEKGTLRGLSKKAQRIHYLPRGGVYVKTSIGAVQFGMPPETIKDSLNLGLATPLIYVIPKERFNMTVGVNVAELEFPTYYNYFIKQRRITLVTAHKTEADVHAIFQESLYGPEHKYLYSEREFQHCPPKLKGSRPDHKLELNYFGSYRAEKGSETVQLSQDRLIRYCFFEENGYALVDDEKGGEIVVYDNKDKFCFEVFDYNAYKKGLERERQDSVGAPKKTSVAELTPLQAFEMARGPGFEHLVQIVSYDDAEQCRLNWNDQYHVGVSNEEYEEEDIEGGEVEEDASGVKGRKTKGTQGSERFQLPTFGLTILGNSHGFDPKGTTTGFVVWVNGKGIMVDPPPHSSQFLLAHGIQPKAITAIILSHCHADHDAGTFQKMITEHKVELLTSATVFESFKRKYSAISNLTPGFIEKLVNWRPIYLEEPNYWNGAQFRFFYSLHSIPCIGFEATLGGKSIVYSADTLYNEAEFMRLHKTGVLSAGRMQSLMSFPWHADVVLHESGVPPIHTTLEQLLKLPEEKRANIYLVHIDGRVAEEALAKKFKVAKPGLPNSIVLSPPDAVFTTTKLLQIISSMEIFEHISVAKALELVLMAEQMRYSAGDVLVEEGGKHSRFVILVSGSAAVKFGDLNRFLQGGDYFGELMFVNDNDIDEEEYVSESVSAAAELYTLELDQYALKNLMLNDNELQRKMEIIIKARIAGCWEAIESNEMLSTLSPSQKNVLQSLLDQRTFKQGEVLCIEKEDAFGHKRRFKWEKGEEVAFAVLILRGELTFDEVHGVSHVSASASSKTGTPKQDESKTEIPPLSTGMLCYDYRASVVAKSELRTTLRASSSEVQVFTIERELFDAFLESNPLVLLGLFHSEVLP